MDLKTLLYIGIPLFVLYIIVVFAINIRKNKKGANYLQQNPDACKLYLKDNMGQFTVYSVDGEKPHTFVEKLKHGIFLDHGVHVLNVAYQYTKQGVVKTTTVNIEPTDLSIEVAAGNQYELAFDRKQNTYHFTPAN